ncbi:MAG: hypothetical protein U1E51_00730, partial [Candidatus Binatia bacterium]|nr:hypothetical protein [Candidatus Binatia bacterium]
MKFICMNPYKPSLRSWDSETIGFLLSYSCAQRAYTTHPSQANATIPTMIRYQYDPIASNICDLFLDFVGNFS